MTAGVPLDHRVGVVVPPANPVVEPELHALLAPALSPVTVRFPVHERLDLGQRLARYVEDTPATVAALRDLPVDAAYLACTGSSYPRGPAGDRAWMDEASAALGHPVISAAGAVADAIRAASVERLRVVSPYPRWLTDRCVDFWTASGVAVAGVHRVADDAAPVAPGGHPIYELDRGAVAGEIERAVDVALSGAGRADAVLVAGTGVATLAALDDLAGASAAVVLLSSNLAAARWLLIATGHATAIAASEHRALARLPAARR